MKKKVGIITICDYTNYGNRLQNYAVQEIIEKIGFNAVTLKNRVNNTAYNQKSIFAKILYHHIRLFSLFLKKIRIRYYRRPLAERTNRFRAFTKKHIKESEFVLSASHIPAEKLESFAYFVTGSDQVWNPEYRYGSSFDFLTFAPRQKRIAFSPSFGVSAISDVYTENYRKWLTEMGHLSVREETGAWLIKELTGRDAEVLVDPTLLLTKEEWLEISGVLKEKPKVPYLLSYFLGEISRNKKRWIKKIAEKNNLYILELADIKKEAYFSADPGEFIDLIHTASIVMTDSFHGAIFSIILQTPFVIFDRIEKHQEVMSSRIQTLLKTMNLEGRHFSRIHETETIFEVDFEQTRHIIQEERQKAVEYITHALAPME